MSESDKYKTISECAQLFPGITESSLRRWIKSGKLTDEALLYTESKHKAGRMVTLINTEVLTQHLAKAEKSKAEKSTVAFNGTNQVAGIIDDVKGTYESFISYLKEEVEIQRARADEAETRAQKAEGELKLLTHQPPTESKVKAKENESKKYDLGDFFMYTAIGIMVVILAMLMMQQFKYSL